MKIAIIALAVLAALCVAVAVLLFELMLTRKPTTEPGEDDEKKESSAWLTYRRRALGSGGP